MKTLSEIKRNIVSFYSSIQDRVTDFTIGSVVNGLFYSFSASIEDIYKDLEDVRTQSYIATATGTYLDKHIDGTYQLSRSPATRNVGYLVVYGTSPLTSPDNVQLKYANFDYTAGEFLSGLQTSTKFIGYNVQGQEGIVYSLIQPKNSDYLKTDTGTIDLKGRNVQFLILPVASVLTGSQVSVREGGIYSFPNPPTGLSGVLNTTNPGSVFFSSSQPLSGSPFYSRYTEITNYNTSTGNFDVVNAYNFSSAGFIEINRDINDNPISATYSDGTETRTAGLIFEYSEATTSSVSLKLPIVNSLGTIPELKVSVGGVVKTLTLQSFNYMGTAYINTQSAIQNFIVNASIPLIMQQRPDQISEDLIFDPDAVLNTDYTLQTSAQISGAADAATDAEYRTALRKYLSSLSKATNTALEAGTLQVPGVSFAKTLPAYMSPRGSAMVLAANEDGTLVTGKKSEIRNYLEDDWKASGINIIVRAPDLIAVNTTVSIKLDAGVATSSITQQVNATIEEYMKSKVPGDSLKYSEVLTALSNIGGITNIFNLILSKQLTDSVYSLYKADYDEAVLVKAAGGNTPVAHNVVGHGFTANDGGTPYTYSGGVYSLTTTSDPNALGIIYSYIDADNFETLDGDAALLSGLYLDLVPVVFTADGFKNTINNYQDGTSWTNGISATNTDYLYFLSYILGEPLDPTSTSLYPIDPALILYENIKDYTASEVEIFRANNVTLGKDIQILVGIKYV